MHIPQREIATSDAAKLVLSNLQKVLADTSSPKKEITAAVTPIFGIRRGAQVVRRVTAERLRKILWSSRNSKIDNTNYLRVRALWKSARINEHNFHSEWGDWGNLVEKYNLSDAKPLKGWVEIIGDVSNLGWHTPLKIAQLSSSTVMAALHDGQDKMSVIQLWKSATFSSTDVPSEPILMLNVVSDDAEKSIRKSSRVSLCKRAVAAAMELPIQRHSSSSRDFT